MTFKPGFIATYDQMRAEARSNLDELLTGIRTHTAGDSEVDQAVTVAHLLDMLDNDALKTLLHAAIDRFLEEDQHEADPIN